MIFGVFHPVLNWCGGAEWVGINIINTVKRHGHQVIVLSDEIIDQTKIAGIYGTKVEVDAQDVLPLTFFPPTDYHNIYTDALRSLVLKSKCDILIDTISNTILPGTDIAYIHYPLLKRVSPNLRNRVFFCPYRTFAANIENLDRKLIFANSRYTARAIAESMRVRAHVLYPPVLRPAVDYEEPRDNAVVTVARISEERSKNLKIVPYVARLTDKNISFLLVGLLESEKALHSILKTIKKFGLSERVQVYPNVPRGHLQAVLLRSKVYFHPAIGEHFGVSIAEAMASGCIPITHDSGGPKEFVPDDFRYRSIEEAAMQIEKSVNEWSPNHARDMSKITRRFSEENFARTFIKVLNEHFGLA